MKIGNKQLLGDYINNNIERKLYQLNYLKKCAKKKKSIITLVNSVYV